MPYRICYHKYVKITSQIPGYLKIFFEQLEFEGRGEIGNEEENFKNLKKGVDFSGFLWYNAPVWS